MTYKFKKNRCGKKGQIMSLLWSALVIFIISVEAIVFLMLFSAGNSGNTANAALTGLAANPEKEGAFNYDCFGPVIPVLLMGDGSFANAVSSGNPYTVNEAASTAFENLHMTYYTFGSFSVKEVTSKGDDSSYGLSDDGKEYDETFYYQDGDKYYKFTLKLLRLTTR